jgi:acetyl coenzyme A synthetase (ADP forming)-like protein
MPRREGAISIRSVLEYPSACEVDVALRDGSTIRVRPVAAGDRPAIEAFLHGLSARSIGFRFFGGIDLDWVADWSIDVDYRDRYALVATTGSAGEVVAHAAYIRTAADRAEVAFTVADAWQRHGIATIMLGHLAAAAEEHGVAIFTAEVLPTNHRMIQVFRDSGYPVSLRSGDGVMEIELPTSRSEETRLRFEQRDHAAAAAAVGRFLEPASVAVIGASPRRGTVGGEVLRNLRAYGFSGRVYAVNRRVRTIGGRRSYSSVGEVPEAVDLAVIAVPAEQVVSVARECQVAGTRALLVISAGFSEMGERGAVLQGELLEVCREAGMRLIGPNCLGVINTAAGVRLNATFAEQPPPTGPIGFLSQSGGLGIAIIEAASRIGLGLSSFVSVGNKADISGNDLLEYWEHDPGTDVVLLYLESFGNPRRFARIARRVSRAKPIVAIKSGRSPAGARATASHTGALLATSDVTVDALFRQAGVIRTDTMEELFDVGALLAKQPIPAGARVAIVTNAGGPGIMCADACQAAGLDVVELSSEVRDRLARFLPAEASMSNPIDMIATAPAKSYRRTIDALVRERACDAIIAIFVPPLLTRVEDVAREIHAAAAKASGTTLAAVFMNSGGAPVEEGEVAIPTFDFPENAARALAHAVAYGRWRGRDRGSLAAPSGCRSDEAAAIIARGLGGDGGWLAPGEVSALFDCYGLALIETRVLASAAEAVAAAAEIGGPVVIKAVAPGLVHKSDAGGVRVGVEGAGSVARAAREIERAVAAAGHELEALIVQPMAAAGVELLMGVVHDESFGPVIACGAGGTSAELLGDVAARITPLSDLDAREMLRSLRMFPLLDGYRGAPACDVASLEDQLLRLSALVEAHPEVAELDANPVLAGPAGAVILDARVRLAPAAPRRPSLALRSPPLANT